jgi:hypothetical protein
LDEADRDGIGHSHKYNRNGRGCRFQGYGDLWGAADEHIGAESDQLRSHSWQAILGLGITIVDDQVLSLDPAVVSQAVKQSFPVKARTILENPKPTTCPLRPRTPRRNEQRRSSGNELRPPHGTTSPSRTSSDASHTSGEQVYAFHYRGQEQRAIAFRR